MELSFIANGDSVIPVMNGALLVIDVLPPLAITINGETSSHVAGSFTSADSSIPDESIKAQLRALIGKPLFKITADVVTGGSSLVHWEKTNAGWAIK